MGFGACHTEFVIDGNQARIIEVNYRLIGDTMHLICSELLGVDLFAEVIGLHLGESLSAGLPRPAELGRHTRIHYVTADREGILHESPSEGSVVLPGGVRIGHRRLRQPGVSAPLYRTNRDYPVPHLAVGDLVVFGMAGAYAYNISHRDFLMHPAPAVAYLDVPG